jgi:NADPH:quinone reductase-like Zn-dependent oxidoreductase
MRAVVTEDFGAAPTVIELARPTPGPGELLVRVAHSSVNGFDNAVLQGYLRDIIEHHFPVVLGRDFAGVVEEVGEGVVAFAPGSAVFGMVWPFPLSAGAYGEYVVVADGPHVARIPDGLDHQTAGVLTLAATAASTLVDATDPRPGETVLVCGATGGVGTVALQLLRARGVTVIATASAGQEADHVRGHGADHVVDRTADAEGFASQVRALAPAGVDVALHLAGDPFALADLTAPGGRVATLLGLPPDAFAGRDVTLHSLTAVPSRPLLESLADRVRDGRLRIPVQRTYSWTEVPTAVADFAAGTIGKLAIRID